MGFYDTLSQFYDRIFPVKQAQLDFLRQNHENLKVLDIACGDGGYLNKLSEHGFYGYGIDLDQRMIDTANKKKTSEKIDFYKMDMMQIGSFPEDNFDLLYCIGNSLVHLDSLENVDRLLRKTFHLLKTGGYLVLQIINYDRVLDQDIQSLPTIVSENLIMKRTYKHEPMKIRFITTLHVDGHRYKQEVSLLPVRFSWLKTTLHDIGYQIIEDFGDFEGNSFSQQDSMSLIIRAKK